MGQAVAGQDTIQLRDMLLKGMDTHTVVRVVQICRVSSLAPLFFTVNAGGVHGIIDVWPLSYSRTYCCPLSADYLRPLYCLAFCEVKLLGLLTSAL